MSKITTRDLLAIQPLLDRINALEDRDLTVYLTGSLNIEHTDGYTIGVAVYEDEQWWIDFAIYGTEQP